MPTLSQLQLAGIKRLQRQFKAAANTHGPLRCVLIHQEGEDFRLKLSPPGSEDMPALARIRSSLYSYRLYCQGPNDEEILCKTATIGTGLNPLLELDEPVSRSEQFAGRKIYVLRNHKKELSFWPIEQEVLQDDPKWNELSRRTGEAWEKFWRLAGEGGRCFGANDCGVLPGVARESLEADDNGARWLWIVFDMAWKKIEGSPLQAERWVWHDAEGSGGHFYTWELNTDRHWAAEWKHASNPQPGPDEAKRIEKLSYLKAWAKQRPQFYYSHLDDLFSASVWAIDVLKLHKSDATGRNRAAPKRNTGQSANSDFLSVQEVADVCDKSKSRISQLCSEGKIVCRGKGPGRKVSLVSAQAYFAKIAQKRTSQSNATLARDARKDTRDVERDTQGLETV